MTYGELKAYMATCDLADDREVILETPSGGYVAVESVKTWRLPLVVAARPCHPTSGGGIPRVFLLIAKGACHG